MSIRSSKAAMRKRILSELLTLGLEAIRKQSRQLQTRLQAVPSFRHAKSIGLYLNMPTREVYTEGIIEMCFMQQKKVYLPRCETHFSEGRRMNHLSFLSVASMEDVNEIIPSGKYKLREPSCGEDVMETGSLDVLVVPGVAFTITGKRLGHGAGYYDEFLHAYNSKFGKVPYLIGLSLFEQLLEDIPLESHDWNLDEVIVAYPGRA